LIVLKRNGAARLISVPADDDLMPAS